MSQRKTLLTPSQQAVLDAVRAGNGQLELVPGTPSPVTTKQVWRRACPDAKRAPGHALRTLWMAGVIGKRKEHGRVYWVPLDAA